MEASTSSGMRVGALALASLMAAPIYGAVDVEGRYTDPYVSPSTGGSLVAGAQLKTEVAQFADDLRAMLETFGLDQQQLAALMGVSRQSLNNWLEEKVSTIRVRYQARLSTLERLLSSSLANDASFLLGVFLKRGLEDGSVQLRAALTAKELEESTLIAALEMASQRLKGMQKAQKLEKLLGDDRPAFI